MSLFRRHHHNDSDSDEETNAGGDESRIDPDLRLRTVRTAHSTLAESIRGEVRAQRRRERLLSIKSKGSRLKMSLRRRPKSAAGDDQESTFAGSVGGAPVQEKDKKKDEEKARAAKRRWVYVNGHLPDDLLDSNGEPAVRYVRNKVRTTKYTLLTFLPKNLFEQFQRIANLYFLLLLVLQLFSLFGAAAPELAWVPLTFIISVTAIKDGIEDYRRGRADEQVNRAECVRLKASASGRGWRNVNVPSDGRTWWEKLVGSNKPGTVSRGVRKLRDQRSMSTFSMASSSGGGGGDQHHSYPPTTSSSTLRSTTTLVGMPASQLSLAKTTMTSPVSGPESTLDLDPSTWELTLWKKLLVGDILFLPENSSIPADVLVLATSSPEDDGVCYVETKNLDGETNLKPRTAIKSVPFSLEDVKAGRWQGHVDGEGNTANLYVYNGLVHCGQEKEAITASNLLLRGCTLRNTKWVIALVLFTGPDTKIMLNGGDTPTKRSKIEKETQFNVIVNFVVLFIMCIISAVVSGLFESKSGTSADFFEIGAEPSKSVILNSVITFASCLIAFQNIVPVSLYISIEIVKTIQAYFINQDIDMYYDELGTSCVPKTWNISDDLGQIEYVFSDKTGTLTRNVMEFKRCSVGGKSYGEGGTEAEKGAKMRQRGGQPQEEEDPEEEKRHLDDVKNRMIAAMREGWTNRWLNDEKVTLLSEELVHDLSPSSSSEQKAKLVAFWRALSICHSVLADKTSTPGRVEYKAESPDEAALVAGARDVGFVFVGKNNTRIELEVMGRTEIWEPLRVLEFNSTRKRMSVVVRQPAEMGGRIVLYCKGADSVIYERLRGDHNPQVKAESHRDLEAFANAGLRTLVVAYRYMSEEEYRGWSVEYDAASNSTEDRDEKLDLVAERAEVGLEILGATALEDKLQEGVPQAIELLHRAGIRCWILTGDKVQTAIEIGYSCNLLKHDMEMMILQAESAERTRALIEAGLNKIMSIQGPPSLQRGFVVRPGGFAVVIDGQTLGYCLDEKGGLRDLFLSLGSQCETVVCCRVSPAQKAQTVKLVKDGQNALTLAIGDGANDVAMIQEANIGCGLFGHEGSQAAMSADYAFGQFRFLTKLLLVHGRWSYQRVADMHGNFFYKNVIWTFAMFWFLFYNSFDATYLYEYTFILLYNLVFTSLPVINMGAFDQDVNAKACLAFPQLYIRGIRGLEYTKAKFWMFMLDGFYQSAVVFFIPFLAWQVNVGGSVSWTGRGIDSLADFGTVVSVCAIFCANQYVGMNMRYWTVITWIVVYGSTLVMIIWIAAYSLFTSVDFDYEIVVLFGSINFWGTLFVTVAIAVGPRFIYKVIAQAYWPQDRDIVREMWVVGDLKDRLGIAHRKRKSNGGVVGGGGLEATSMVQNPHARSMSELSMGDDHRGQYIATGTDTPQGTPKPSTMRHFDESPPPPPAPASQTVELFVPQQDPSRLSPGLTPRSVSTPRSEVLSYYSASEIPSPSPVAGAPSSPPTAKFSPTNPYSFAAQQQPHQQQQQQPPPTSFRDPSAQHIEMTSMRSRSEMSNYETADEGDETSTDGTRTLHDHHHQHGEEDHARPSFDSGVSGPVAY